MSTSLGPGYPKGLGPPIVDDGNLSAPSAALWNSLSKAPAVNLERQDGQHGRRFLIDNAWLRDYGFDAPSWADVITTSLGPRLRYTQPSGR
jgi:hypothetical protein